MDITVKYARDQNIYPYLSLQFKFDIEKKKKKKKKKKKNHWSLTIFLIIAGGGKAILAVKKLPLKLFIITSKERVKRHYVAETGARSTLAGQRPARIFGAQLSQLAKTSHSFTPQTILPGSPHSLRLSNLLNSVGFY